jgi:anti-sigma B factor antagonist
MAFQRYNKNYVSMTSAQAETAYRLTVQVIINAGFLRRKNMNITKEFKENVATLNVSGRLDTTTAPALEAVISETTGTCEQMVLDFAKLEYISSAGLRVILKAQKVMAAKGGMKLLHVNETIMEIFEITGFSDILTIE